MFSSEIDAFSVLPLLQVLLFHSTAMGQVQPNVVVIIVDDLGIGDIGSYGNSTIKTPNIDSIATNGVKFAHNLAGASVCTPSRAALLTGRYAIRSGLAQGPGDVPVIVQTSASGGLPSSESTFAEFYKKKGYKTAYLGKWHLGIHESKDDFIHHPCSHGFDYYYGIPLSNILDFGNGGDRLEAAHYFMIGLKSPNVGRTIVASAIVSSLFILLIPMKRHWKFLFMTLSILLVLFGIYNVLVVSLYRQFNSILMRNYEVIEQPVHLPDLTQRLTAEATSFINMNANNSFLLVMAYHKVHVALAVPENFRDKSKHGIYGDAVEEVDWSVGRIVRLLEELNLQDRTFVYLTSDHGPALYMDVNGEMHGGWKGKFKGGKGDSWEGGIRVPTMAMWPSRIPMGVVFPKPTSGLDLFPTLLNIIGEPLPADRVIDGIDLLGSVTKTYENIEDRFLFHYCGKALQAMTYIPYNSKHVWKLHFQVPRWDHGTETCSGDMCDCFGASVMKLRPTLLFDISNDPYEEKPYSSQQDLYKTVTMIMTKAVTKHKQSILSVEDQLSPTKSQFSWTRQMCCNFPFCSCREHASKVHLMRNS